MSLWKIAWRSIQQRSFSSALTALSMSLGVGLVVAVLVVLGVMNQQFSRGVQGYDLIIGAKGSRLELVLSTVFHVGRPGVSIPNRTYYSLVRGQYSGDIGTAVPVCMGDTFKSLRIVGTTPAMFDVEYQKGKTYEFQDDAEGVPGRCFAWEKPMEAVLGAKAAEKAGLKVGDTFRPVHGGRDQRGHEHDPFTVVGILKPTGTPTDRGVFVNIRGFYAMHEEADHDHASEGHAAAAPTDADSKEWLPLDKEITALLVILSTDNPSRRIQLPRLLERDQDLNIQAVEPNKEVDEFSHGIMGNVKLILLILAALIVLVAGIGILVSMYNSMSERRHEIAIMRALGARRATVMVIMVFESILLSLGGGAIGLVLGHGLTGAIGPIIERETGVTVSPLQFQSGELILIPALILLATVVGYLPALMAYRTDVSQSLISSP